MSDLFESLFDEVKTPIREAIGLKGYNLVKVEDSGEANEGLIVTIEKNGEVWRGIIYIDEGDEPR